MDPTPMRIAVSATTNNAARQIDAIASRLANRNVRNLERLQESKPRLLIESAVTIDPSRAQDTKVDKMGMLEATL